MAETTTIRRKMLSRPKMSDIQPDRIRPLTFPSEPATKPMSTTLPIPACVPNGTSWLMSPSPAIDPKKYATQSR